jgi:site-specific DNA-methyltransferase (adenine-specific)
MGKRWDYDVPSQEVWAECLRVLKPGGHLLAFAGTRTQHRMAVRIEDAGFEIRDMIAWVYGSGFPKSLDVSKAIDKAAGAERDKIKTKYTSNVIGGGIGIERPWKDKAKELGYHEHDSNIPATEAAKQWSGFGTSLKPALEPITLARKPFKGTVAENVLEHGTGALNVDGCRVGAETITTQAKGKGRSFTSVGNAQGFNGCEASDHQGRWPANLIHDGSEEVARLMTGGEARFFYTAKASKTDRDEGCDELEAKSAADCVDREAGTAGMNSPRAGAGRTSGSRNHHPTVKPTDLMRYLCRLVTPPGGVVLDPFMGSGSTGKAAILEGFAFIGIEREAEYIEIARARIAGAQAQPKQKSLF